MEYFLYIIFLLVGFVLGNVLKPYIRKRAENLATLKDIQSITKMIEEQKHVFASDLVKFSEKIKNDNAVVLERLKSDLTKDSQIHHQMVTRELELCNQMWRKCSELQWAADDIRRILKFEFMNPNAMERLKQAMEQWNSAFTELRQTYESGRPFLSEHMINLFKEFSHDQMLMVSEYTRQISNREHVVPSYEEFLKRLDEDWRFLDYIFEGLGAHVHELLQRGKP